MVALLAIITSILTFKEGRRLLKRFDKLDDDYFDFITAIACFAFSCVCIFITFIGIVLLLLDIF